MTAPRVARHAVCWAAVYVFWLLVTRDNQPTLPVAVAATALLVGTATAAVYADWYALRPRLAAPRRWAAYAAALLALVAALTFPTVVAIQAVYDAAGVPDEGRFGFWTNVGTRRRGTSFTWRSRPASARRHAPPRLAKPTHD